MQPTEKSLLPEPPFRDLVSQNDPTTGGASVSPLFSTAPVYDLCQKVLAKLWFDRKQNAGGAVIQPPQGET